MYPKITKERVVKYGCRDWIKVTIETKTHTAHTDMPVLSHKEYAYNHHPMRFGVELLGVRVKPHVRVKMRTQFTINHITMESYIKP